MTDEDVEELAEVGLKISGAVWGSVMGGLVGGPIGAVLGAMASYGWANAGKMAAHDRDHHPDQPYSPM